MATITKRKNGWSVQVRRKGYAPRSQTFPSKATALAWAREQEGLIDQGRLPVSTALLKSTSLHSLLDRYRMTITPKKLSAETEDLRLRRLQLDTIAELSLEALSSCHIADYRDRRLQVVKPGTVRRELYLLANAIDTATKEWGFPFISNSVRKVSFPIANDARDRRLEPGEAEKLQQALSSNRNPHIAPIVALAIETGLRRREVLELTWSNVDLNRRVALIPLTKTGQPRTIPLTDNAIAIIGKLSRLDPAASEGAEYDRLFPITLNAFKQAWKRVQQRAGLGDFRFHDLRHEALSRFCELGLSVPELSVISGHKDPRMLFRYTHLRADNLAKKLAGKIWTPDTISVGS